MVLTRLHSDIEMDDREVEDGAVDIDALRILKPAHKRTHGARRTCERER